MRFTCRSYLIILFTEVRDIKYVTYFAAGSLWLCLVAKCKTFNVLYVGRCKYLSSTVNIIVARQMYTRCQNYVTDTKEYLLLSLVIATQLESEFAQLHLLKFLFKFCHFSKR